VEGFMRYLIDQQKLIDILGNFNEFKTLDSTYEKIAILILLFSGILILSPAFKRVLAVTTMNEFDKLILSRKEKTFVNLLISMKDPVLMLITYISYSLIFIFTLAIADIINNDFVKFLGVLILLLFIASFFMLSLFFFVKIVCNSSRLYKLIFVKKIGNQTINEIFFYVNSFSSLFVYTLVVYNLFQSTESQPVLEFLLALFLPILLYLFYENALKNNRLKLDSIYYFRTIEPSEITQRLIFLYNIDSTKTVLTYENNPDIKIIYNFETDAYYEYKKTNKSFP
jgi:hypothetical protein